MELILHCLTPKITLVAFGVWLSLVSLRPLAHPVLYLHKLILEAVPKYISGRTSYLRVRLAFHLYPQLIPSFCTSHEFDPPVRVNEPSIWPWVAHPVSGLIHETSRPIQTRFRYGSGTTVP